MGSINRGVRVGAAAFAVGVSLAGPQAVGVAWAEGKSRRGQCRFVRPQHPGSRQPHRR